MSNSVIQKLYQQFHEKRALNMHLKEKRLHLCADRVPFEDWKRILTRIAHDRNLSEIVIYSRCRNKKIQEINTEEQLTKFRRCRRNDPVLYTNFFLRCLVDSIATSLTSPSTITSATLDGVPLPLKYLKVITEALQDNQNLIHLAFIRCRIGDTGCQFILDALRNNAKFKILNLSGCCLTVRSAQCLADFLKRRKAWILKNTLGGYASQDCHEIDIQGIQSLILNKNPKIGDCGLKILVYVLRDDFWMKHLGLRHCDISKNGAKAIIDLLEANNVIMRLDLKENKIPDNILQSVVRILKEREKGEKVSMTSRLLNRRIRDSTKSHEVHFEKSRNSQEEKYSSNKLLKKRTKKERHKRVRCTKNQTNSSKNEKDHSKRIDILSDFNLYELSLLLTDMNKSNYNLSQELQKEKTLYGEEKQHRLKAENQYRELEDKIKGLQNSILKQKGVLAKTRQNNEVCAQLQIIFDELRNVTPCKK
ncbi:protein Cep78 homolog isoform X2 [Cephus cinctus]|uniref:Protein Cep78 homolog isoform X2 n=1 Tax=Cephus cinctus TaxID=211228 RepID=A0AAJ7C748_CEPCN|nr:protein Cep78 homolog isoform X2 [Cephus cinctus]